MKIPGDLEIAIALNSKNLDNLKDNFSYEAACRRIVKKALVRGEETQQATIESLTYKINEIYKQAEDPTIRLLCVEANSYILNEESVKNLLYIANYDSSERVRDEAQKELKLFEVKKYVE